MDSLRVLAKHCLEESDVDRKVDLSIHCYESLLSGNLSCDTLKSFDKLAVQAGRPEKPTLVPPETVPRRGLGSREGIAALLHAITHIEFNAINLAWDAVYRFSHMPVEYYTDWSRIAYEETQHFLMLRDHLRTQEYDYGDFDAHDGLWQMAERTSDDVLVRMALIPRVLEARGLDVTPDMIKKLNKINEKKAADILKVIYKEEIGHVERGTYWFYFLCEKRKLDPRETFQTLLKDYFPDGLRGPFNLSARAEAGFSEDEIKWLEQYKINYKKK